MSRTTSSNGSKPERDELRRSMQAQGCTLDQIANEMARRYSFRPRTAWRHAHGWGQVEAAARYNELVGDGNASMSNRRISDFEAWPIGGTKPTSNTLSLLAQLYHTSVANLVDADDLKAYSHAERRAISSLTNAGYATGNPSYAIGEYSAPNSLPKTSSGSGFMSAIQEPEPTSDSVASTTRRSVWSISGLISSVASESLRHAEEAQGNVMPNSTLEEVTTDVERLAKEYLYVNPTSVFTDALHTRNTIYRFLDQRQYPNQTRHLYFLAAITCSLLADSSMGFGQRQAALEQTRASWMYAEIIGHNSLRLKARTMQASLAFWDNRPQHALSVALSATEWATEPIANAFLRNGIALFSAATSQPDEARAALTVAADAYDAATGDSELFDHFGGAFSYTHAKFLQVSAATYVELGELEQAERNALETVRLYETGPVELRAFGSESIARIDLARIRFLRGDLEGTREALAPVFNLPAEKRLNPLSAKLRELYQGVRTSAALPSSAGNELGQSIEGYLEATSAYRFPSLEG